MTRATMIPLRELVSSVRRSLAPTELRPEWRYILLEHISQRTGEVAEARVRDYEVKSAKSHFELGDILYGKLRPQLRKCCVAPESGACSGDIVTLRPIFEGSAHYISAVLRSEGFAQRVQRLVAGANLPRVNVKELLALEIPWPDERAELARRNMVAREAVELRAALADFTDEIARLEASIVRD